jgi:hypothetical protein
MTTITLPRSIDEARKRLEAIERLFTSRGWERAAIIASLVRPEQSGGRPKKVPANGGFLNVEQFAALGIAGLRKPDTVRLYVTRWLDSHEGIHPEPGAELELPNGVPWPPVDKSDSGSRLASDPAKAVAQVIDKHGIEPVADAIAALPPEPRSTVSRALGKAEHETHLPKPKPRPDGPRHDDAEALHTAQALVAQFQSAEAGEWAPGSHTRLMWQLLGRMLGGATVDWDAELAELVEGRA